MTMRGVSGNMADVNNDHQQLVNGVVESDLEYASEAKGKAFAWSSSFATGSTGIEVIYIKNTSTTERLIIDEVVVGAAAACIFTLFEVTSGTAAGTTVTGQNWNLSSGNAAAATALGDASVTGTLTGPVLSYEGVSAASEFAILDTKGGLVLGQDKEVAVTASANTTVYVTIIGHYKA